MRERLPCREGGCLGRQLQNRHAIPMQGNVFHAVRQAKPSTLTGLFRSRWMMLRLQGAAWCEVS